jgi:Transposase
MPSCRVLSAGARQSAQTGARFFAYEAVGNHLGAGTRNGVSNGGTEAINLIIEKTRRLAHGFRTFAHYRLRILLAASGTRSHRRPAHA